MQEAPEALMNGSDLKNQVDELVDVYNEIAEMLSKEKETKVSLTRNNAEPYVGTSEEVCGV